MDAYGVPVRNCAFVNFTNIANAIKAIEAIKLRPEYANLRISHGKDRCANAPRIQSSSNGGGAGGRSGNRQTPGSAMRSDGEMQSPGSAVQQEEDEDLLAAEGEATGEGGEDVDIDALLDTPLDDDVDRNVRTQVDQLVAA